MSYFYNLFKSRKSKRAEINQMINNGGIIIDVRTAKEFSINHIKDAKNIPFHTLNDKIEDLKKLNKPCILCCTAGIRSAQATKILKKNGVDAINGGVWNTLI